MKNQEDCKVETLTIRLWTVLLYHRSTWVDFSGLSAISCDASARITVCEVPPIPTSSRMPIFAAAPELTLSIAPDPISQLVNKADASDPVRSSGDT
uniref:Uncharacterized protein n=1 Tax=Salix viminalis TaxID=40686 RepID=A0A6N2KS71_SALVM